MLNSIKIEAEKKMKKSILNLKNDFASIRTGRANPSLLDKITIEYYGTLTPLNQIANISAPEPRMLVIQPWDAKSLGDIEKAIVKSDLGLNPSNDGKIIRLIIPQLTEERRKELSKLAKKYGEEAKIAIRNIRRDSNDELKKQEKDGIITEDNLRQGQDEIQKLTDKYIKEIDILVEKKVNEIMEV
ncbi:ribosome recycling factor [Garciella nitratireducens]|uniref:Ribosome-recycling factor n=1 Tax=Garciella nitratireducens DSM 15102 TaxID=1121911 RepID=A0A1T4JX80_9FIRM|nr:ribosome recycling factor [Garciella nitratireducens]SJZ34724.1 ribosome recycling factor [Garciella nitratireducens DSM 15102]